MDPKTISAMIETGAMGTLIILVSWMVRRVFTHTIPRLAADFREALKEQQETFANQLESQRNDFKQALSEQRNELRESMKNDHDDLGRKMDRLTVAIETMMAQMLRYPQDRKNT